MRPTPAEVVAGVRRILSEVVAPEVTSDYAASRLRAVLAVLADVDWDNAPLQVVQDNHDLRTLLEGCGSWVADDPGRAAALADYGATVRAGLTEPKPELAANLGSFADANELNATYRRLLEQSVVAIAAWLRENPADASAQTLSREIAHHLATQPGERAAPAGTPRDVR
jgi:hypothetical protein